MAIQFADTTLRLETRLGASSSAEELTRENDAMRDILATLARNCVEGRPITLTVFVMAVDPHKRTIEVRFTGVPLT